MFSALFPPPSKPSSLSDDATAGGPGFNGATFCMVARRVVVAPYLAVEFRSLKTELGPEFTAMVKGNVLAVRPHARGRRMFPMELSG